MYSFGPLYWVHLARISWEPFLLSGGCISMMGISKQLPRRCPAHLYTTSLNRRIRMARCFCAVYSKLCQYHLMLQQKSRLARQRFPIFCCPVLDCILSFLFLADCVVFCFCASAYLGHNEWLFELLSPQSNLAMTPGLFIQKAAAHSTILCKLYRDGCVEKNPSKLPVFKETVKLTCLDQPVYTQGGSWCQIYFSSLF